MPTEQSPDEIPEFDASTLKHEEWFFLYVAFGQKPDATLRDANEYRVRALGMPRHEQMLRVRMGLEMLKERGAIKQATDAQGKPVFDSITKEPVYVGVGRIVVRVQEAPTPSIIH